MARTIWRRVFGIPASHVAREIGVSRDTFYTWTTGSLAPRVDDIAAITGVVESRVEQSRNEVYLAIAGYFLACRNREEDPDRFLRTLKRKSSRTKIRVGVPQP